MKKKEYYTVKEAAEILGVTPKSVWNWIKTGRIKAEQEFVKGEGWGKDCFKISHSELQKEKQAVSICLWCKKVIEDAKYRRVRKYCSSEHKYLYKKSIGYYDQS